MTTAPRAPSRVDRRRIIALALPAIAEMQTIEVVRALTLILLRDLGPAVTAGVGLTNHVVQYATYPFQAIATGAVAIIAQSIGARRWPDATRAAGQAWMVGVACGLVLFALFQWQVRGLQHAMGAGPDAIERTLSYARWQGGNLFLLAALTVQSAAIRASGDTMRPLVIMAIGQAVHLALLPLLIRGWGGMAGLGVNGAGIASFVGMFTATVFMHVAWLYRLRLRGQFGQSLRPHAPTLRLLVGVGTPALGERLVVGTGQALYIRSTAGLGTVVYAAHQIIMMITTNIYAITHGFTVAATVVAAQNLGAGNPEAAKRGVRACVWMNVWISSAIGVALALSLRPLAELFTTDPRVADLVVGSLICVALYQPVLGPGGGFVGSLQGAGDTRWPLIINMIGLWGLRLPLVYLCAYRLGWGLTGSWVAMAADLYVRAALATWRFRLGTWTKALPLSTAAAAGSATSPVAVADGTANAPSSGRSSASDVM